jgi:uncharacterized membrane protein
MTAPVLATFPDPEAAREAVRQLRQSIPDAQVRLGERDDVMLALQCSQQVEMDQSVPMAPMGVVAGPFARGVVVWGGIGLLLGLVLAVPVGLLMPTGGASRTGVLLGVMLAGALAGTAALGIYGAGRQPEVEGEGGVPDPRAVVRVDLPDAEGEDSGWSRGGGSAETGRRRVDELLVQMHAVDVFHPRD